MAECENKIIQVISRVLARNMDAVAVVRSLDAEAFNTFAEDLARELAADGIIDRSMWIRIRFRELKAGGMNSKEAVEAIQEEFNIGHSSALYHVYRKVDG